MRRCYDKQHVEDEFGGLSETPLDLSEPEYRVISSLELKKFGDPRSVRSCRPTAEIADRINIRAMRPKFDTINALWRIDGSLRDLYVQSMDLRHWRLFDTFVHQNKSVYSFDGNPAKFPGSEAVFANREGHHILSLMLGSLSINCHFFVPEQLELDISPREVLGTIEHDAVLKFVEQLSETLGLPVDVTPENSETAPFITYSPAVHGWQIH